MSRHNSLQETQELIRQLYVCRAQTLDERKRGELDELIVGLQLHQSRLASRFLQVIPSPSEISAFRVNALQQNLTDAQVVREAQSRGLPPAVALQRVKLDRKLAGSGGP